MQQGGYGPQGGAPPQGGGYGPPQGGPPGPPPNNVGVIIAAVWLTLGVFACLATGGAAVMSEQTGVNVATIAVPLFVGGLSAMIAAPMLRTKSPGAAIGGPIGCGCLGFVFGGVVLAVFFTAIWPSL